MEERGLARFKFKMVFGWIFYVATSSSRDMDELNSQHE